MSKQRMYSKLPLPMVEGKCPPVSTVDETGNMIYYYPDPEPDYKDPEVREEDKFAVEDKDEFWGYVTMCKKCGARFQGYDNEYNYVRNFCPGCGERLVEE